VSRLHRGLWHVELTYDDRIAILPPYPVDYDVAAVWLAVCADDPGIRSAILRRVPGTRSPWEFRAPYEASDKPSWGDE
jgi:hypothetical protein